MGQIVIRPMAVTEAEALLSWRYDPPYEMYNSQIDDIAAEVAFMTDPSNHYFAILEDDDCIGHAVFHTEARVPGGDYSLDALDVGVGMRPDQTGQGAGTAITRQVMAFARERYGATRLRATVAEWNKRAQQVCLNNGFTVQGRFQHPKTGMTFVILVWANDE